jgi:hypothetical protein
MNDNLLLQEFRDWIESRLSRIERRVPTFTTQLQGNCLMNGEPMVLWFCFAHWGSICSTHHVFSTN